MILVKKNDNSGFSLIELIAVIVLLGILGIVALGRFGGSNLLVARGFFDDTVAAVRFAQKLAISSGCDVRVITAAGGYELRHSTNCTDDNFTELVDNPANRNRRYQNFDIPDGFTLTGGIITFDARGQREEAGPVFSLSDGSTSYSFRVNVSTGLVEVL